MTQRTPSSSSVFNALPSSPFLSSPVISCSPFCRSADGLPPPLSLHRRLAFRSSPMKGNSRRPAKGEPSAAAAAARDWRSQLQHDARQRIVNKIMDLLKRQFPISVPEGLHELQKIAVRLEENMNRTATTQSDYLRKISLRMLSLETKTQYTPINPSS